MVIEVRPVNSASLHAWNKDRTRCAISTNSKDIIIFKVVTGIDWAPNTDRIASCAADRTAYVWNFDGTVWQPTLVLAHLTHAATCIKWSPKEDKFAIGSSAKIVAICHYEAQGNWWVSKQIRKHSSAVLAVAWHPNNVVLATACADFRCRVLGAAIKKVDKRPTGLEAQWGDASVNLGEVIYEFPTNGWVHDVAWSPSGLMLGWTTHDASVTFASWVGGVTPQLSTCRMRTLPQRNLMFLSNSLAVAVGWELSPILLVRKDTGEWSDHLLDTGAGAATEGPKVSGVAATLAMFQGAASRGQAKTDISMKTVHQNTVQSVQKWRGDKFSTAGLDGKIVFWEVDSLAPAMAALKL